MKPFWVIFIAFLVACNPTQTAAPIEKLTSPAVPEASASVEIQVAAAADLQFAFTEIAANFEQQTGNKVTLIFGSTGQLAQQIENGAPYDLFAAANRSYVDELAMKNRILPKSIELYARGRIVLAVNRLSGVSATTLNDLLSPKIKHIAIANPEHAPYGLAAKQAFEKLGLWEALKDKVVFGENIRQALQYVQTGDAEAGIVSLSVADVPEITWTLIDDTFHQPIDQALGVVSGSPHQDITRQFAAFINGEIGRPIMRKYGFVLPGETIVQSAP
jgi:molybdate transport system substrate-binding protein